MGSMFAHLCATLLRAAAGGVTYACEKSQLLMHDAPDRSPPPLLRRQAPQTLGALSRSCQLLISAHLRCLFVFG